MTHSAGSDRVYVDHTPRTRSPELRSIAKSIEPMFPDAADLLRGIARELDDAAKDHATYRDRAEMLTAQLRAGLSAALDTRSISAGPEGSDG